MNKDPPMGAKGAVSVEKVHGVQSLSLGNKEKDLFTEQIPVPGSFTLSPRHLVQMVNAHMAKSNLSRLRIFPST